MAIAGEVQNRFADRLRRDRAGVERDAAQQLALPFDDEHAPILLRRGDGRLLSGRSAAHHDQIVSHVLFLVAEVLDARQYSRSSGCTEAELQVNKQT